MARKTRFVIWSVALALFLFILSHLFGVFKPQQHQQAPPRIFSFFSSLGTQSTKDLSTTENHSHVETTQEIHIAAAVCAGRTNESLVMMKSALIMSRPTSSFIRFTLFADIKSTVVLNETIRLWPNYILKRMSLDLRPLSFPDDGADDWKTLFKPCATERLFFPSLLKEVDSVLYMDVDTVFLSSPLHIWQHFSKMNQAQMVALTPLHEDYATGWYNKFAGHPYYGKFGVNSGVMLMNLTKMRLFGWGKYVVPVFEQYRYRTTWGDQDIINVVFHFHPEKLYVYPCNYNYCADHCSKTSLCKEAEEQGIYVLHGNTENFISDRQPAFKAIFTSIQEHAFGDNLQRLLANMKDNLIKTVSTNCGKVMNSLPNLLI